MPEPYTGTWTLMTAADLAPLVVMLQAHTPLMQLSNMEARTVFEFLQGRGYLFAKPELAQ